MYYFNIVETILRDRHTFFAEIRNRVVLGNKISSRLIACLIFLALYGIVMGASHRILQAISSMIKLPILFLVTLLICTPSLHYFNILFGSKQTLPQTVALVLTAITTTAVLLLSFAAITLFFLITSSEYTFFKLLNVSFFALAGTMGILFRRQDIRLGQEGDTQEGKGVRYLIFVLWVILYGFVGSQMAWTLSPFIGRPDEPFGIVSQVGGNFYSDVITSLRELVIR
jgi:hypothetical protein